MAWCRALIRRARGSTAAVVQNARRSAAKSCKTVRARAYAHGYSEGRRDAQINFFAFTARAESLADDYRRQYREECIEIAFTLAEEIVGAELLQRKDLYHPWLQSALEILPPSGVPKLHYHPDQKSIVSDLITDCHTAIDTVEDPSLQLGEVSLRNNFGGVDFSWRHALTSLRQSTPSRR